MAGTAQMPRRKLPLLVRALIARPKLRRSLLVELVGTIVMFDSPVGWKTIFVCDGSHAACSVGTSQLDCI
jgi:hypothetical protein